MHNARGRCSHCGSLAVEGLPVRKDGGALPWGHYGRRIGSLGHNKAPFAGGDADFANLGRATGATRGQTNDSEAP
jgi:hypothetical protein